MGYLNVEEMLGSMTQRQLAKWETYWDAEPWGPWRDNLHAAIIAREVRRPSVRKGSRIRLEQFMVRDPNERKTDGVAGFIGFLKATSKPVKREDYKHDRSRKTRSQAGGSDRPVHERAGRRREKTKKV